MAQRKLLQALAAQSRRSTSLQRTTSKSPISDTHECCSEKGLFAGVASWVALSRPLQWTRWMTSRSLKHTFDGGRGGQSKRPFKRCRRAPQAQGMRQIWETECFSWSKLRLRSSSTLETIDNVPTSIIECETRRPFRNPSSSNRQRPSEVLEN